MFLLQCEARSVAGQMGYKWSLLKATQPGLVSCVADCRSQVRIRRRVFLYLGSGISILRNVNWLNSLTPPTVIGVHGYCKDKDGVPGRGLGWDKDGTREHK
ncbi:hypothetical protein CBL_10984 [Carabus blaptoides fortunei]